MSEVIGWDANEGAPEEGAQPTSWDDEALTSLVGSEVLLDGMVLRVTSAIGGVNGGFICLVGEGVFSGQGVGEAQIKYLAEAVKLADYRRLRIERPPGNGLLEVTSLFFSQVTVENLFEATLADLREAYFEVLNEGRVWKARMERVRVYGCLARNVLGHPFGKLADLVRSVIRGNWTG